MGCMSGNVERKDPLDKKMSRSKNDSKITEPSNEDEEKMVKHRERIIEKKKKESPKKNTMDEQDLINLLNEIFDKYDKDKDGALDLNEFMEMLHTISMRKKNRHRKLDKEQVRRMLSKKDEDGDISVNRTQFYELYKQI